MTILENTMKEVLLSDKDIIERLTIENNSLKERITELENINQTLFSKLEIYEKRNEELVFKLQSYEDAQHCQCCNCINKNSSVNNNNNEIENSDLYINLKKDYNIIYDKNKEMENQIEELTIKVNSLSKNDNINEDISSKDNNLSDSKIQGELDKQKIIFEREIEKRDTEYNTLYNNFNKLNQELNMLKQNTGIPTPSNSDDIKIKKKKKNNGSENPNLDKNSNIIKLSENVYEIVYYRNVNNNKLLPRYHISDGISYLECCGKQWNYKELNNEGVTCLKCYKTYKLNEEKKLIKNILPEHIIQDEKDILLKIKCNNKQCNYISKKEIELCYKCKNIENCEIIEYDIPNKDEEGYETKLAVAAKCYFNIEYISSIFDKAYKEGLVKNDFKDLVDYVKRNKIIDEKQKNIIINKIVRSHDIYDIYNLDKYKLIHSYIKRLEFSLKAISKLDDSSFRIFKDELIEKLDNELKKINGSDNPNLDKKSENINKDNNINNVKKEEYKDENICSLKNCIKNRHTFGKFIMRYCIDHMDGIEPVIKVINT